MKKEHIFVLAAAVLVSGAAATAVYAYTKRKKAEPEEIPTAYSYDEAIAKAREKIANGYNDDRVRLVPAVEKPDLKVSPLYEKDMINYTKYATKYETKDENYSIVEEEFDISPDDFGDDETEEPKYAEPVTDFPPEAAEEAELDYKPMHDEDLGSYFRISEDTFRSDYEHIKVNGMYKASKKLLMMDGLGLYIPESELVRRIATIIDENEEDFADSLYFAYPEKNMHLRIQIDMS